MMQLVKKIGDFIDEKPVLASATMLPPLLALLFYFLGILFHWFEAAPKYEPVFARTDSLCVVSQPDLQLKVLNGVIYAKFIPRREDGGCYSRKKIYRYNTTTKATDEISRDEVYGEYDEGRGIPDYHEFEIKGTKGIKIVSTDISLDGYKFTVEKATDDPKKQAADENNVDKILIQKNGRSIELLPLGTRSKGREIQFLGWTPADNNNDVQMKGFQKQDFK